VRHTNRYIARIVANARLDGDIPRRVEGFSYPGSPGDPFGGSPRPFYMRTTGFRF
jgi:hypothetical protein